MAPPGEYDRTVPVRWRCGLFVKLLRPLVCMPLVLVLVLISYGWGELDLSPAPLTGLTMLSYVPIRRAITCQKPTSALPGQFSAPIDQSISVDCPSTQLITPSAVAFPRRLRRHETNDSAYSRAGLRRPSTVCHRLQSAERSRRHSLCLAGHPRVFRHRPCLVVHFHFSSISHGLRPRSLCQKDTTATASDGHGCHSDTII